MTDYAIRTDGLSLKVSKGFELTDVSLRVPQGAVYGFLGPNGSGKSTTVRCVMGMRRPTAGSVTVVGCDMAREPERALARVGYVPERPHLYPTLTVREAMQLHRAFWSQRWDAAWADRLVQMFELPLNTKISRLSKGETGKALMLMALAQRPDLLILDEPTDGLDPVARRDVLSGLLDYVAESGASVFISSHLVHELERICDWVGVMEGGRLVAELPMQTFKDGLKRLRVHNAPSSLPALPFALMGRATAFGGGEEWIVRGWQAPMDAWFTGVGATLHEVVDLDLEEGFVELLRAARARREGR